MAKTYRPYMPEQTLLLPPALSDWVPEGHLARFISDVVNELDLSEIEAAYEEEERGYPPYHPVMMVKVFLYGYATGVYSSRRLAAKLEDSVAFRYLAAGNEPDFRTLSEFRRRHAEALSGLFVQVLRLCQQAGLVKLGRIAVDGTKIKANASKHKAMSYGRMKTTEERLAKEVRQLLDQAEATDQEEDRRYGSERRGDELPEELSRRESRLKKIREAKAALEAEAKKKGGGAVPEKAQRNFTDPESRIQKSPDGFIQGYNPQLAVDEKAQVIVACEVTAGPDVKQMVSLMEQTEANLGEAPEAVLADAGYYSEANDEAMFEKGVDAYIAVGRHKHGDPIPSPPRGPIPRGATLRDLMDRKLRTRKGRRCYALRKTIVEPVIGQIKQARGFRQFLRRGLEHVREEWSLICTAHNLLKLFRNQLA
jgi:transposase